MLPYILIITFVYSSICLGAHVERMVQRQTEGYQPVIIWVLVGTACILYFL